MAVGGLIGVLGRYGLSRLAEGSLLWPTLAINVVGSFLLGLLVTQPSLSQELRDGLGIGLLGGFTTFST